MCIYVFCVCVYIIIMFVYYVYVRMCVCELIICAIIIYMYVSLYTPPPPPPPPPHTLYTHTLYTHRGLDLRKYVKAPDQPDSIYDLFAVSNHFGGMGGGHCTFVCFHGNLWISPSLTHSDTAYCKNKSTGKWYNFDDSHVSEATDDRIVVSHVTVT